MRHWITQVIVLMVISTVLALAVNAIRDNGIGLVGKWPSGFSGKDPVVPPSAGEGDPPFVTRDGAAALYQSGKVIFVDARPLEDYALAHIARSVNIPYDYLDENWERVIDSLDHDREYVIYCSGDECESSLLLGRHLKDRGFSHLFVFYGGWREWQESGLPVSSGQPGGAEEKR